MEGAERPRRRRVGRGGRGDSANETLKNGLASAADGVAKFGAKIAEWAKGQDIAIWADTFKRFFETLRYGFSRVKNGAEISIAVIRDNVETVGTSCCKRIFRHVARWALLISGGRLAM